MNNAKNSFLRLIVTVLLLGLIVACSDTDTRQSAVKIEYLLPQLREASVNSIWLSSKEGSTELTIKNGLWWVADPVDYLAQTAAIESFVRTLSDAEVGKRVNVAPADLAELDLADDGNGIAIKLGYGEGQEISLIIGDISFPEDASGAGLLGAGYAARRYIRVKSPDEAVYLVPISLVDLTATSGLWTDFAMVRVPSFRRLQIIRDESVTHDYFRHHPYGALYLRGGNGVEQEVAPDLLECFEGFLKKGECNEVANAGDSFVANEASATARVVVEDFVGLSYSFRIGAVQDPTKEQQSRAQLSSGAFNDGIASATAPFTIDVSSRDMELNAFELALRNSNLAVAKRLSGRIASADFEGVYCLLNLLEGTDVHE